MARTKPKSLKGDKRLKEAPRFKAIYGYEDDFKLKYRKTTNKMLKDIILKANSFTK